MSVEDIKKRLYGIFLKFIPEKELVLLWDTGRDLPLTGTLWKFDAIKMTYLFLEVKQEFSIQIKPKYLEQYRFNSVNGIINAVVESIKDI